ncbi:MAG: DegT/DnrJ/EryC1/StrS family aminotransferase [Eubacteriales bacterium]|jgi:dTDP-4-amino-4,6-dideoxygalactose transaminase|nr:DegT/DnrJ/EryC1/StrS family aminotransferase [Eubacteriales bacterium]
MQKKNPPILVTRPSLPPVEEYEQLVREIFSSRFLTNGGAQHQRLEAALQEKLKTPNLRLFTNGHLALECAISALNLEPGEIITTPLTFISTTHAIVRCGFTPVFCDVEPDFFTLDATKLEERITPRTRAILPVHVYGNPCDMAAIDRIAKRHHLPVLYDAAHAFGVTLHGRAVASFGTASMFSFHATKCYNTIEGGAVATKDAAYAELLNGYKNFGFHPDEEIREIGGNAKMNEFQAAMGLLNLKYFDREIEKRGKVATRYRENLSGIAGLSFRPVRDGVTQNYAYLPVSFDPQVFGADRDQVSDALKQYGIFARKYFNPLTSEAACYAGRFDPAETPVSREASQIVLTLPMYADLALTDVDDICEIVAGCKK